MGSIKKAFDLTGRSALVTGGSGPQSIRENPEAAAARALLGRIRADGQLSAVGLNVSDRETLLLGDRCVLQLERLKRQHLGQAQMFRHQIGGEFHIPAKNGLGQCRMFGAQITIRARHSRIDAAIAFALDEELFADSQQPGAVAGRHQGCT